MNLISGCAEYKNPMSRDYLCKGCDRPVHWFCSANATEYLGHDKHFWSKLAMPNKNL